jgi:pimeloyl-ACP methyl ester carboxylesterase
MGSSLYDDINNNNQLTIDEKAWFGIQFPSLWLAGNGIDPAGSYNIKVAPLRNDAANTLRDELNSMPMDLFKGFFDNLEANGYVLDDYDDDHNEGENLFCFTYDWRKDNTTNAQRLSNFIDSVLTWTGSAHVNLVGHSMGGIVSKTCTNLYDNSRIDKIVFIGTPHLGAPEVLTVMLKGRLFEWLNLYIEEILVRSLARNLPACYQLITSSSYFNIDLNNGVSDSVEVYLECFQLPNGSFANYSELIDYLGGYSSSLGEDLNDALLDSSVLFREKIDTVDFGNVEIYNIVGYNHWTIGKNKVVIGPPPLYWITIEYFRNLNGDFTVPVRSAELINNQIFEHTYYVPNVLHHELPGSQQILEILLGVFSDPPITYFPQYSDPPPSYRNVITYVETNSEIINSFYLAQNFPNPFNPSTTITYELPVSGYVTLKIYDVLGNEIATLVDEEKTFGIYELTFIAGNLPSGTYFYQLLVSALQSKDGRTKDFLETKKMILLR